MRKTFGDRRRRGLIAGLIVAVGAMPVLSGAARAAITGTTSAHDPSELVKEGSTYWYYATGSGPGLVTRKSTSSNLLNSSWSSGATVFSTLPAWVSQAVPGVSNLWAPEIDFYGGQYHLYYAASTFGSQVSAIGMATSPTLNQASPNYGWTDQGKVISSAVGSPYNTIDPSILHAQNGTMWMSFGSFWQGIYITQLDPTTGLRLNPAVAPTRIARKDTGTDAIEASYLYERNGYYYLFDNWNYCCQGVNSTYEVRVGRSTSVLGPYLDADGVDLANGGGTQLLDSRGVVLGKSAIIGPGQSGIYSENGTDYLSFHYYNGNAGGAATYDLLALNWTAAGWPTTAAAVPEPSSLLVFGVGAGVWFGRRRGRVGIGIRS